MTFRTDFEDPAFSYSRVHLLLYGAEKAGKTRTALKLVAEDRDWMVMLSTDNGILWVRDEPELFQKKLALAQPTSLKVLRNDLASGLMRVKRLIKKGVPPSRIWFVIDNLTHMQMHLLCESRKVRIGKGSKEDEYLREMVIEADWGINLGHMSEAANLLAEVPCNVITIALEKSERDSNGRPDLSGTRIPALSGQSYHRFTGDADAILQLNVSKNGERYIKVMGDRSSKLKSSYPPDLKLIQETMMPRRESVAEVPTEATDAPAD